MIGTRERIGRWPKVEWKAEECETKMSATGPKTLKKPLKKPAHFWKQLVSHEDWCLLSVFLFFGSHKVPTCRRHRKHLSQVHIEDPQTERGATFSRQRPHHWFPRWHQRWSYKYPPHVLIEECVCFNWNAKALNTHMSLHNFFWGVYSTVNIVSQIESKDTQPHAGVHPLHIISDEKKHDRLKTISYSFATNVTTQLLHTGKAKSQRDHCGRYIECHMMGLSKAFQHIRNAL